MPTTPPHLHSVSPEEAECDDPAGWGDWPGYYLHSVSPEEAECDSQAT